MKKNRGAEMKKALAAYINKGQTVGVNRVIGYAKAGKEFEE